MAAENNPFYIRPPNVYDALMAGVSSYERARKSAAEDAMKAGRLEAVQTLQSGGDVRGTLAKLIGIGDVKGAEAIANFANQQSTQQFRQQQLSESGRHNRALEGISGGQLAETRRYHSGMLENARKPTFQVIEDSQGNKQIVKLDPFGGSASVVTPQGAEPQAAGNPYSSGGKLTDAQSNAALYSNRMISAEKIFRDPKVIEAALSFKQRYRSQTPVVGNYLVDENFQKFDQAQRNFINATLRRESGAVINPSEFENAERQYFPQPGDSKAVLAQKARNRAEAIMGIGAGAGKGYRPQTYLGPNDEIVDSGAKSSMNLTGPGKTITGIEYTDLPPLPAGFQLVK